MNKPKKVQLVKIFALMICIGFVVSSFSKSENTSRFKSLELFNKVMFLVESSYYREVSVEKLIQGALNGMIETLDPHSAFLDQELYKKLKDDTEGEYHGLGIEVTSQDNKLIIVAPIEDSPAFKAGILPGDQIIAIQGQQTIGLSLVEAMNKLKVKQGEKIELIIKRENQDKNLVFSLKKEKIKFSTIKEQLVEGQISYVRVTQFSKGSAQGVADAIQKHTKLAKNSLIGIILDLRNNPGGLLDEAIEMASLFLVDGQIVSTESRDPEKKEIHFVRKTGYKNTSTPLILLINGASASASEIVAGALQDSKRAILMGSLSFGKGTVQQIAQVADGYGIKLTIAQYLTRTGRKIQALGIRPDIELDDNAQVALGKEKNRSYIREIDLRNHLTATIETAEEEKIRKELEGRENDKKMRNAVSSNISNLNLNYRKITEDYQILMSINQLKGLSKLDQNKNYR